MGLASEFQLVDGQGKAFGIQIPRASAWGGRPLERSIVQDGTCKPWETIGTKAIILQLRMVLNCELCWIIFSPKKSRFGLSKCEIRCGLGMSGPQSLMQHRSVKWLVSFKVSKACNQAALAAAFNCHGTNHHAMRPDWIIHLQDAWPRAPPEHSPASLPGIDA